MDECLIFGTLVRLNNVNSHPIKLTVTIKLCGGKKGNLGISKFQLSWNVILASSTFSFLPSFHPEMSSLLLTLSVHKPIFQDDGYCVLFLGLAASFHSLLPLLFTSALSITLLF